MECPTATIANVENEISSTSLCWCQFGTDMTLDPSSEWTNCLISSLSDQDTADDSAQIPGQLDKLRRDIIVFMLVNILFFSN